MRGDAPHPVGTRLGVPVLDTAAGLRNFIRTHGRIANEYHSIVGVESSQKLHRRGKIHSAAAIVLPEILINKIVKVEMLQVLELAARRREQLLANPHVIVHRAARIEQQ